MWFSFFLLFCMLCGGGGFFMLVGMIGAAAGDLETNPTYDKQTVRNNGSENDLALIDLNGMIASFAVDANGHNQVQSLKRQFKWANNDDSVEAILFRINSPGGEVLASDEIADIVRESDKPVIAVMGAVAASGGYYVAAPADWIVAHELTITGSIGVIMSGYSVRNLMDKAGVQPIVFKSGKNKDMLSMNKREEDITDEERKIVQDMIGETFGRFKKVVREGRDANNGTAVMAKCLRMTGSRSRTAASSPATLRSSRASWMSWATSTKASLARSRLPASKTPTSSASSSR